MQNNMIKLYEKLYTQVTKIRDDMERIGFLSQEEAEELDKLIDDLEAYIIIIESVKKIDDLENHKAVMDNDEMTAYIESIGRNELYQELKELHSDNYILVNRGGTPRSRYLKAIEVGLVTMGYDTQWVYHEFRDALNQRYDWDKVKDSII